MISILEEANKRLLASRKKYELQIAMKQNAQTLKLKYLQKKTQNKKKIDRERLKSQDKGKSMFDNSMMDSLDLSIITRKESIHSLHSIGRIDNNFSSFDFNSQPKVDKNKLCFTFTHIQ